MLVPRLALLMSLMLAYTMCQYIPRDQLRIAMLCDRVPESCENSGIKFYLYSKYKRDSPVIMEETTSGELILETFDQSLPVKVIIHGVVFGEPSVNKIRDAYLDHGAYNVIMLDYGPYAYPWCYDEKSYPRFVGRCTASLIRLLWEAGFTNIHMIGFSLGTYVAAHTARHLRPNKLPRITGLDPGFSLSENVERLDENDAQFVDIIFTSRGTLGSKYISGHVDFYMNGGKFQPGCGIWDLPCHHTRAVYYFAESIASEVGFWAWKCSNLEEVVKRTCPAQGELVLLGEHVKNSVRGIYNGETNAKAPFAKGNFLTAAEMFNFYQYPMYYDY